MSRLHIVLGLIFLLLFSPACEANSTPVSDPPTVTVLSTTPAYPAPDQNIGFTPPPQPTQKEAGFPTATYSPPTPTDTSIPTPIPVKDRPVIREVSPQLEVKLPTDVPWIWVLDQIIANDQDHTVHDLTHLLAPTGREHGPSQVQAAPDGSTLAYTVFDRLVIEKFAQGERWIYQPLPPEDGFIWVTTPIFAPDSLKLVYAVIYSQPVVWAVKQVDLLTGEEIILPIDEAWYASDQLSSNSGGVLLATKPSLGGPRQYAFVPIAWTEQGIYGGWILPFTDAGISSGWLYDPATESMHQVLAAGWASLPSPSGQFIAYTSSEVLLQPSDNLASELKLFQVDAASSKKLLDDELKLLIPIDWAPNGQHFIYYVIENMAQGANGTLGIIKFDGSERQELDLRAIWPTASILDLEWLDPDHVLILFRKTPAGPAEIYLADIHQFVPDQVVRTGDLVIESDLFDFNFIYVPDQEGS